MNQKNPLISIIIPVCNGEKYLSRLFNCIDDLKYANIEVIFINNGSSDTSLQTLYDYSSEKNNIIVINSDEKGVSKARNLGIEKSKGDYLFFFDCDDTFESEIVNKCVSYALNYKKDTVIYNVQNINAEGQLQITNLPYSKKEYSNKDKLEVLDRSFGMSFDKLYDYLNCKRGARDGNARNGPWRMMYKSEIIKNNNILFPENLTIGEDTIFGNKYICYAQSIGIIDEPLYYLHVNSNSTIQSYMHDYERMINEKQAILEEKKKLENEMRIKTPQDLKEIWGGIYIIHNTIDVAYI